MASGDSPSKVATAAMGSIRCGDSIAGLYICKILLETPL